VQFCVVDVVDETKQARHSPPLNSSPSESSKENHSSSKHSRNRRRRKVIDTVTDGCLVEDDKQLLFGDVSKSADDVIPASKPRGSLTSDHGAGSYSRSLDTARDNLDVGKHGSFDDQSRLHLGLKFGRPANDGGHITEVGADGLLARTEVETIDVISASKPRGSLTSDHGAGSDSRSLDTARNDLDVGKHGSLYDQSRLHLGLKFDRPANEEGHVAEAGADVLLASTEVETIDVILASKPRGILTSDHGAGSDSRSPDTARDNLDVGKHGSLYDQSRQHRSLKFKQPANDGGHIAEVGTDGSLASTDEVETIDVIPAIKPRGILTSDHGAGSDSRSSDTARDNLDVGKHGSFDDQSRLHLGLKFDQPANDRGHNVEVGADGLLASTEVETIDVISASKPGGILTSDHGAGSDSRSPDTVGDNLDVGKHGSCYDQSTQHLGLKFDEPADDGGHIAVVNARVSHASTEVETIRVSTMVCYRVCL